MAKKKDAAAVRVKRTGVGLEEVGDFDDAPAKPKKRSKSRHLKVVK